MNQQSLLERLESISRQLGLIFTVPSVSDNIAIISSEMFRIEVTMASNGTVRDVRIGHIGEPSVRI